MKQEENRSFIDKAKKPFVLISLFILPLLMYMFFQSAQHNSLFLPVVNPHLDGMTEWVDTAGDTIEVREMINIVTIFGHTPDNYKYNILNLNEKIYKNYHEFEDLQFITLITEDAWDSWKKIDEQLQRTTDLKDWRVAIVTEAQIEKFFYSMATNLSLEDTMGTPYAFIIDRDGALRGRNDDEDASDGMLYGYETTSIAAITNKMNDDVRILLREYRLALKSNMSSARYGKEK